MCKANPILENNLITFLPIEKVMFSCFEDFKRENNGQSSFNDFKEVLENTNLQYLYKYYPVAEKILLDDHSKVDKNVSLIDTMFSKDKIEIQQNIVGNTIN